MRRSIDDQPITESELPTGAEDALPVSWAIAICDDYDDATPRVVLTVEDLGRPDESQNDNILLNRKSTHDD